MLDACCWMLVAGCWLLVAGCWLLVAGLTGFGFRFARLCCLPCKNWSIGQLVNWLIGSLIIGN